MDLIMQIKTDGTCNVSSVFYMLVRLAKHVAMSQ